MRPVDMRVAVLLLGVFALLARYSQANIECRVGSSKDGCKEGCHKCGAVNQMPDSVIYLKHSIVYTSASHFTVTISWDFRKGQEPLKTSFPVDFELYKTYHTTNKSLSENLCFCLPKETRHISLLVSPYYFPTDSAPCDGDLGAIAKLESVKDEFPIPDCLATMGSRSLEVCGVQIPSAPLNVSAELRVNSSTNVSTIAVNWSPPLYHNAPVEFYLVQLLQSSEYTYPANQTTALIQLNSSESFYAIKVRAGIVNQPKNTCYHFGDYHGRGIYYGGSSMIQFQWPPATVETSPTVENFPSVAPSLHLILYTTVPSSTLVLIVLVVLTILVVSLGCLIRRYTSGQVEHVPSEPSDSELGPIRSVFLVSSPEESEETQERLRHLVHDLADHGIEAVYYQYERAAQHAASPGALGIARWVEHQFQRCDLVLFACTRTFSTEWSRENGDVIIPVVWSSRHVLDGILPHQDDISRFGVVLMGDNCDIPVTLRRFQLFRLFQSGSDSLHSDHLIRYITRAPQYAPPRVSRSGAVVAV